MAGIVEGEDEWDLGDIYFSKDGDVHESILALIAAIQSQCHGLSIPVNDKAGAVFWLALRGLVKPEATEETKVRATALYAMEIELSAKARLLEYHEKALNDENRSIEHHVVNF